MDDPFDDWTEALVCIMLTLAVGAVGLVYLIGLLLGE